MGNKQIDHAGRSAMRTKEAKIKFDTYRKSLEEIQFKGKIISPAEEPKADHNGYDMNNKEYHSIRSKPHSFNDCGYPIAIFFPIDKEDVSSIVKGLKSLSKEIRIAVAGGRHSHVCYPDGAIVIDLENLSHVSFDINKRLLTVGGGVKIQQVDQAMKGSGFGFVTGTNGDTGVAGLTLGGGLGFLSRKHGFACDNVIEIEIVLASGEIVIVNDQNEYKDLMRCLRGEGPKFGIVVQFKINIHPVPPCIAGSIAQLCPTKGYAETYIKNWNEWTQNSPEHMLSMLALPCGAPIVAATVCGMNESYKSITSYKESPEFVKFSDIQGGLFRVGNDVKPVDYHTGVQTLIAKHQQRGFLLPTSVYLKELTPQVISTLLKYQRDKFPNRYTAMILFPLIGKSQSGYEDRKHVLKYRNYKYWMILEGSYAPGSTEADIEAVKEWIHQFKSELRDVQGELAEPSHPFFDKDSSATQEDKLDVVEFVQKQKQKYDPEGFFQF